MRDAGELGAALKAHSSAVFAVAYRILADRASAEEVAQDVFLEFWRAKKQFAGDEHARCWFRRVAVHRSLDTLRRAAARPSTGELDPDTLPAQSATGSVPGKLAGRLGAMVASLPPEMCTAIVLRYGEDELTPEEIAVLLRQPVATVKSNLARGLALLRRHGGSRDGRRGGSAGLAGRGPGLRGRGTVQRGCERLLRGHPRQGRARAGRSSGRRHGLGVRPQL